MIGQPASLSGSPLAHLAVDRIMAGAIDLHHHGYPEVSFAMTTRMDDEAEFRNSRDAGMAAVVLKSHMWPTVGRAYLLNRLVPGIEIIPSITLNTVVGGFSPLAIESAALQGARAVFMPTWSAVNDLERGGFSRSFKSYLSTAADFSAERGLRVIGPDGKVLPEVKECLAVIAEHRMVLNTGHISPKESIALAEEARLLGINEIVFSHPDSLSIGATRDDALAMAELGAYHEYCVIGALPALQRTKMPAVLKMIEDISAQRIIITTDYFYDWFPPGAEMMRLMAGSLLYAGIPESDVVAMIRTNPERLLQRSWEKYPPRNGKAATRDAAD